MPTTLDIFFSKKQERLSEPESSTPEEKKYRKIYIVTRRAYEKYCSKCKMLFKAEEIESPMFRYRVFRNAESCVGKISKKARPDNRLNEQILFVWGLIWSH